MPKLRVPLLSFDARGAFGKLLSVTHRHRKPVVERKPIPTDAKSSAQLFSRHMFSKCKDLWHTLSEAEKQTWESAARPKHMTGYAWYISQCLRPNPGIYLPLQGGTMSGDIDMDKNRLLKLPLPTHDQEAASKKYHDDNMYSDAEADARIAIHAAIAAAHHVRYADAEADARIAIHAAIAAAHHAKYTDAEVTAIAAALIGIHAALPNVHHVPPAAGAVLVVAETEVFNGNAPVAWTDLDLSGTIGANVALVLLKVQFTSSSYIVAFRKNGDTDEFYNADVTIARGCVLFSAYYLEHFVAVVAADSAGKIEWKAEATEPAIIDIIAYLK